jgi:hypothetical protein
MSTCFGVMMLATIIGMSMVNATSSGNAFAVSMGQSWTWKVTKCVWDNSNQPKFIGKGATITITNATNTTSFSWIKGNVTLLNADGSTIQSLTDVILGNISTSNASILAVYANSSNFVLPIIIPFPLDQTFAAFAAFINSTFNGLIAQYGSQIPFTLSKNYTINAATISSTSSKFSITFYISGTVSGYTITDQPVELSISIDGSGVVTDFTAIAKSIKISSSTTVDLTIFEITRTDVGSSSIPGYSIAIVALGVVTAVGLVAVNIKRRK